MPAIKYSRGANRFGNIRIATVTRTGERYIVQQCEFRGPSRVHCWGDIWSFHGTRTKHRGVVVLLLKDVVLSDAHKTEELCADLFKQTVEHLRGEGRVVCRGRAHFEVRFADEEIAS